MHIQINHQKDIAMEIITDQRQKQRAFTRNLARRTVTYIVVCAFLAFVNFMTSPGHWWVLWVIAGWGIGIIIPVLHLLLGCEDTEDMR